MLFEPVLSQEDRMSQKLSPMIIDEVARSKNMKSLRRVTIYAGDGPKGWAWDFDGDFVMGEVEWPLKEDGALFWGAFEFIGIVFMPFGQSDHVLSGVLRKDLEKLFQTPGWLRQPGNVWPYPRENT
jgi:hypothetical protein